MTEDIRTEELLFMAKKIGLDLTSQLEFYLGDQEMSGVQAYFMVYILRHHPEGTYLTELCREIGLSKSTLSAMLKKVRKAGYILFREEPEDIRKKKILPTDKLRAEDEQLLRKADRMESELFSVLDQQEKSLLWKLERKLLLHLTDMEHSQSNKDRRLSYSEKSYTAAGTV
ncbi:MarR family winged helix-turn-helix transcriptional regulator [Lachnoclostridium phocaeense]|uniref:MarR family winged helix-turn-helix transcriptional regulator n=1 Tax=Lachnoclostridium phocaeense TaxID=1871021 RepID=UPI00248E58D7|nr:MarR family transcriptional regulator [Lachnoclostridium phocaeense]